MITPTPTLEELWVSLRELDDGFAHLDGLRAKSHLGQGARRSLSKRKRVAYGGCHHTVTIIEHGRVLLRKAVTDWNVACVPAMLMRLLIEWCARAHWLLWLADEDSANVFLSGKRVEHKDGDAVSVPLPETPAPSKTKRRYLGLADFVNMCRTHEQTRNVRSFLEEYGTQARLEKLNKYVHGGVDEMLSGFPTDTESQEFSHRVISGMIFVFGGAMFMAYRNIAEIIGADRETLELIREHEERFYLHFSVSE